MNTSPADIASKPGMSSSIAMEESPEEALARHSAPVAPAKRQPWSTAKRMGLIIGAILVAAIVVVLVLLLALRAPAKATPTTRTQDFTAATTTMETTVGATGTIQPAQRADLSFSSAGTVTAVNVAVGDVVTAGEALASIDLTALQSAVDQAQAAVTAAQDDYNTAAKSGTSTSINAAKSTLTTKQNALTNAQTALTNGTLTAPFAGTVAIVGINVGDKVGTGTSGGTGTGNSGTGANAYTGGSNTGTAAAAITVITTDTYQVTTSVGSADVGNVKKGQPCTVTPNGTASRLPGTVTSVGVIATSTSAAGASFPVTIDVTGAQQGLYAGVSATISIVTSSRSVLAVPTAAITRDAAGQHVQVRVGSGTQDTLVQTGATSSGQTEITAGLSAGDVVVVTITTSSAGAQGPGAFASMFGGGGGGRQRPNGAPSGGFPGGFPSGGNPGNQPTVQASK